MRGHQAIRNHADQRQESFPHAAQEEQVILRLEEDHLAVVAAVVDVIVLMSSLQKLTIENAESAEHSTLLRGKQAFLQQSLLFGWHEYLC